MKNLSISVLAFLLLFGCAETKQEAKEDNPTIPKSSSETLKKAQEVERQLKEAAEKRKAQLEKAEGK